MRTSPVFPLAITTVEFNDWYQTACQDCLNHHVECTELHWLLKAWTDLDRISLQLGVTQSRSEITLKRPWQDICQAWQRRITERVPVQYLVGEVTWRDLQLTVSPAVLIPRPETELLVELATQTVTPEDRQGHWVDLGTGSGAIALGLARQCPDIDVIGVDCSADAVAIAEENARRNQIENATFVVGNWWQPIQEFKGQIQGLVTNPPYIPTGELPQLQPEVFNHEPLLALDGGETGLAVIEQLLATSPDYLASGSFMGIEVMAGQAPWVAQRMAALGRYQQIQIYRDLAGIERFVVACTV